MAVELSAGVDSVEAHHKHVLHAHPREAALRFMVGLPGARFRKSGTGFSMRRRFKYLNLDHDETLNGSV